MITKDNYTVRIKEINTSTFPEDLKELHSFFQEATESGKNWNAYEEPDIKALIDAYLKKLNDFAMKTGASRPETAEKKQSVTTQVTVHVPTESKPKQARKSKGVPVVRNEESDILFVERIPDEIRIIRRFLSFNGKRKTKEDFLRFINFIHRSIIEKKVRKTSPYAKQVNYIQEKLLEVYNAMGKSIPVEINEKTVFEFKQLIGSEKVMPSVQLIKRYINLNGKFGVKDKAKTLVDAMTRAVDKGKLTKGDQYIEIFDRMHHNLSNYIKSKTQKVLSIEPTELNGLNGFLEGCGCGTMQGENDINGLNGVTDSPEAQIMSLSDARNATFDTIGLTGEWRELIGDACKPTHLFVYGSGGSGKSSFILQFAEYLNKLGNKILYVAGEQFNTPTFSDLVRRLNIVGQNNFDIVKDFNIVNPSQYDFVALDSKDSLGIEVEDFRRLKQAYPQQSFLISSQGTKSGDHTGSGQWRNEVDTMIYCEDGVAKTGTDKNRWGGKGQVIIFHNNALQNAA
jgi:hypothetical protein